jgi:hypothetical protein
MRVNFLYVVFFIFTLTLISEAQIITGSSSKTTLTVKDVDKEASWSPNLKLTENGLTTDRKNWMSFQNFWVQTQPIAIGDLKKPSRATGLIDVIVKGKIYPDKNAGTSVYFRYSCDRNNWSTWYELKKEEKPFRFLEGFDTYEGSMRLPKAASEKFDELKKDWLKTNPVSPENEQEFSLWLIKQQPDFFAKEFPFIGYIQVRVESSLAESWEINEIVVDRTWLRSGLGRTF